METGVRITARRSCIANVLRGI